MRKLCPNFDREDGLETVLEVPIPEEMFASNGSRNGKFRRNNSKNNNTWMTTASRFITDRSSVNPPSALSRNTEIQLLLGVVGAPLIPLPVPSRQTINNGIKVDDPIEASMAKYIVQQYIAAAGGEKALNAISSMYAMGKVRMAASEFRTGGKGGGSKCINGVGGSNNTVKKYSGKGGSGGEMGGFVLWQKKPDLWCLELVVSGCKISAGSDGKVAWRQTPWHQSHASRGPPRPLRRSMQGLDPRSTANLFSNAVCIGEKAVNGDDCFVLRLDAESPTLRARSSSSVEIVRHTVWGYFSHRTGLLVQLEDSHLLRIKGTGEESVYWETTMETAVEDYRPVDGVNIAHAGRSTVSLFRYGDTAEGHTRTRMEETWTIEEVDFNIWGLSMDCFLPPGDMKKEQEAGTGCDVLLKNVRPPPLRVQAAAAAAVKIGSSQVAAVDETEEETDSATDQEEGDQVQ